MRRGAAAVEQALALGLIAWALIAHSAAIESYHRGVQEDGWVEWATFWAFLGAAGLCAVATVRRRRARAKYRSAWFLLGVGAFLALVLYLKDREQGWFLACERCRQKHVVAGRAKRAGPRTERFLI